MSARLYTLDRYELRKLAEEPMRPRWDDDAKSDWLNGLLAVLAFCCLIGWLDARDNEAFMTEAATKAQQAATEARQALKAEREASGIRWIGEGYECRFRVLAVYHNIFARECQRLGAMLADARME